MRAEELPQLVEAHLGGTLGDAQRSSLVAALSADAGLRRDFVAQLRIAQALEAGMREHDASPLIDRVGYLLKRNRESQQLRTIRAVDRRLPRRRARRGWTVPALAATAAAALILFLVLQRSGSERTVPSVLVTQGTPHLVHEGMEAALSGETALSAGDRIRCDAQSSATLGWPGEETVITLAGGADLTLGDSATGKRLRLDAGRLEATVAKQPPDRPLIIATPRADARVVGTRFDLAVAGEASFLQVAEGTVALQRGTTVLSQVSGGSGSVVDAAGPRPMGAPTDLFAGGVAAWHSTRGAWRLEDGVATLQDPAGESTRIESLATWRDFELTCELRASGGRAYTEIQVFDTAHCVTVHHTVDDPAWKQVRLTVRRGRIDATGDGQPLEIDRSQPLPEAGTLAFFVTGDKRLEIAHARIRDLPRD
jgi:hypothetical protein